MIPRKHASTHMLEDLRLPAVEPAQLPVDIVAASEEQESLDYMVSCVRASVINEPICQQYSILFQLIDILLVVQSEMSKLSSITHEVPFNQLKKMLAINTRAGEVKLFKNILLLKHARLLETCPYEDQSIKSIYIIFPVAAN